MTERLTLTGSGIPRPIRLLIGATSLGISERRLRRAVAGKIVLITGASSGVGEATARRLAAAGATVLLVARSLDRLERLRTEIESRGGTAHVYQTDLTDLPSVEDLARRVLGDHGCVDVFVNNAGRSIRRWISESYDRFRDFQGTMELHYLGPVRLLLELLPVMRARRRGHIVNVSTFGVDLPPVRWTAYVASKNAFEAWLRGAAAEARADGVTATSIHLQGARTPMLGPFRIYRYLPIMSAEEAAGMVARAIVIKPRVVSAWWSRLAALVACAAHGPVERLLALYCRVANPASRRRRLGASLKRVLRGAGDMVSAGTTIRDLGVIRPLRPDRVVRVVREARRWGMTPAFAATAARELYRDRLAVVDERESLTFGELDLRVSSLAAGLRDEFALGPGSRLGLMCRNHSGFILAALAGSRLGADLVLLNTDFSGPQVSDVVAREGVDTIVCDPEFSATLDEAGFDGPQVLAWDEGADDRITVDDLVARGGSAVMPPVSPGRIVLLTSGTTGTPKGVTREVKTEDGAGLVLPTLQTLAKLKPTPRAGTPIVVGPPLFHGYGFGLLVVGLGLGYPLVLRRRFDPRHTLAAIAEHRASILAVVPTMLVRILGLPVEDRRSHDTSSLRMVLCGAAALPPELGSRFMDEFGDILFNGYGTGEIGGGTLATPADLRAAPATVGFPALGARLRIFDERGLELPAAQTGRIFVKSPFLIEGYTGGGCKEIIDGYMSTGDMGHLDALGRLYIEGREDDMIVSGGENVFPQEVEELLARHEGLADAAAVGVPDEEFGQRLAAFVVRNGNGTVSADELRAFVKANLARYKVPRDIVFVDQLPRNAMGKVRRKQLASLQRAA